MVVRTFVIVVFVLVLWGLPFLDAGSTLLNKTSISINNDKHPSAEASILSSKPTLAQGHSSLGNSESKFAYITHALNFASGLVKDVDELVKSVSKGSHGQTPDTTAKPMDCAEIYLSQKRHVDGLYKIWPRSRVVKNSVWVYCDMESDGGGWTLIQRRGDFGSGKDYFYKNWESYKTGFGDLQKDFWIGNDIIFALTNQRENTLRFVLGDFEGNKTYAEYDKFWIDDEEYKYTAHVEGYRGNAGDSFTNVNKFPFTTNDRDNDKSEQNCAVRFKGAWWYDQCHTSNLNGQYLKGIHESFADGIEWKSYKGYHYSLKDTFMKIRPIDFAEQIRETSL